MGKDWKMRRYCITCSAVVAAELGDAYRLTPDQADVRKEVSRCERCGKQKQTRAYWLEVAHG